MWFCVNTVFSTLPIDVLTEKMFPICLVSKKSHEKQQTFLKLQNSNNGRDITAPNVQGFEKKSSLSERKGSLDYLNEEMDRRQKEAMIYGLNTTVCIKDIDIF